MNGWIKLHRKSLESSVFRNPTYWQVWCWCLMRANHEDNKIPFNGRDFTIVMGEFITSIEKGSLECNVTERKWRNAINYLKKTNRLTIKTTNKFTVISIQNWKDYQVKDNENVEQTSNKDQTNVEQTSTDNKDKNEKNDKTPSLSAELTHASAGAYIYNTPAHEAEVQPPLFEGVETRLMDKEEEFEKLQKAEKERVKALMVETFNQTMKMNAKKFPSEAEKNLEYWLDNYGEEGVLQAIRNIPKDKYWSKKTGLTLVWFLRRRNPSGQPVDYVGTMLALDPIRKKKTWEEEADELMNELSTQGGKNSYGRDL